MTIEESNLHEAIKELYLGMPLLPLPTSFPLATKTCGHCGTTEGVTLTVDPYARDIDGDESLYPMCAECVNSRADDI